MAWNSLSEILSSCSLPGMQLLSTSGSLSFAHTTSRLARSWTCPFMVIAIAGLHSLPAVISACSGEVDTGSPKRTCATQQSCPGSEGTRHGLGAGGQREKGLSRWPGLRPWGLAPHGRAATKKVNHRAKGGTMPVINADGCPINVE